MGCCLQLIHALGLPRRIRSNWAPRWASRPSVSRRYSSLVPRVSASAYSRSITGVVAGYKLRLPQELDQVLRQELTLVRLEGKLGQRAPEPAVLCTGEGTISEIHLQLGGVLTARLITRDVANPGGHREVQPPRDVRDQGRRRLPARSRGLTRIAEAIQLDREAGAIVGGPGLANDSEVALAASILAGELACDRWEREQSCRLRSRQDRVPRRRFCPVLCSECFWPLASLAAVDAFTGSPDGFLEPDVPYQFSELLRRPR